MAACTTCGKGLSIGERARRETKCADCRSKEASALIDAQNTYKRELDALVRNPDPARARSLSTLETAAGLLPAVALTNRRQVVTLLINRAVDDAILTVDEERRLDAMGDALLADAEYRALLLGRANEIIVGQINAGRLEPVTTPSVILKKGEIAYFEVQASLLKDVAIRQTQGSYSGVSFRVAKGVRVNTGGYRGHSVVVGHQMIVDDHGLLTVTSSRVIFSGAVRSLEFQYAKLLSIDGFEDGVRLRVSNRVNASTFKLAYGPIVLAAVNHAVGAST